MHNQRSRLTNENLCRKYPNAFALVNMAIERAHVMLQAEQYHEGTAQNPAHRVLQELEEGNPTPKATESRSHEEAIVE